MKQLFFGFILSSILLYGCFGFKLQVVDLEDMPSLEGKLIVLHYNDEILYLKNAATDSSRIMGKAIKYSSKSNRLHIYVNSLPKDSGVGKIVYIPFSSIEEIKEAKTNPLTSIIVATLALSAAIVLIISTFNPPIFR